MPNTKELENIPDTESILAPIVIGSKAGNLGGEFLNRTLKVVIQTMPSTRSTLNIIVQGNKQAQPAAHERRAIKMKDKYGNHLVRLCDLRSGEENSAAVSRWRWEVRCTELQTGGGPLPFLQAKSNLRLEVTGYRISGGLIDSSVELALFRHLFVEGLKGVDENLIVRGGQSNWQDAWWTPQKEGDN